MTLTHDPELLGLSGFAGAGKDTVATILAEYQWQRVAQADGIREALYQLNPRLGNARLAAMVDSYGWDFVKRTYPETRRLLQRMGDMGKAMFGKTVWLDRALDQPLTQGGRYVITDVRYPFEADAIRKLGGRIWRIHRTGYPAINGHTSETALLDYEFDAHIDNDGTLDDLHTAVVQALTGTTSSLTPTGVSEAQAQGETL